MLCGRVLHSFLPASLTVSAVTTQSSAWQLPSAERRLTMRVVYMGAVQSITGMRTWKCELLMCYRDC